MEISISLRCFKAVHNALGANAGALGARAMMHSTKKLKDLVPISLANLDLEGLTILRDQMKAHDEDEIRKVSKLINILKDSANKRIDTLADFPKAFKQYLADNGQPFLHSLHADLRGVAYLPGSVTYNPPDRYHRAVPSVTLVLHYNVKFSLLSHTITLHVNDMRRTIPEILRAENLMIPDESMSEEYKKIQERFSDFGTMHGEQFQCRGTATAVGDRYWWASEELSMTQMGKPTKAVLDLDYEEDGEERSFGKRKRDTRLSIHSDLYEKTCPVPVHPVLPLFSLHHHRTVWVNVVNMKRHKYEENLRDKLVLPPTHTRLIGALIHNLDALREENEAEDKSKTIRAKASSSIILAKGPPGTGKTLTAEVYANEIKRPLYEVQSGQIGVEAEQIEENLKVILNRSVRLRMPLLINEADVFIKERGDDAKQNAIVCVFLRLLEYHNGLVFLTTNRAKDIDDAILNRCIARLTFNAPGPRERLRLWEIMLAEFNVALPKSDVRKAVLAFPRIVGRDIQNLVRLTNRVCIATETEFSLAELRENALFQDIPVLTDEQLAEQLAKKKENS